MPENIFGNAYKSLREQLKNTPCNLKKVEILNQFFKNCFTKFNDTNAINNLQHVILDNRGNININSLYMSFGKSRRSLERNFLEEIGVCLKYFCRILRFNYSYALKRRFPDKNWNEILYTCGYYDQSHYIREFKSFMGISPDAYFLDKHANLDVFTGRTGVWKA
jgi:AraC-like DNA-binding protein